MYTVKVAFFLALSIYLKDNWKYVFSIDLKNVLFVVFRFYIQINEIW